MVVADAWSDDKIQQLEAAIHYRKIVSTVANPKIAEVIQSGVVPRLVEFLVRDDFPQLQVEAAWILKNIAVGTNEETKVVIDHGAVPILVKLLTSPDDEVREQVIWALGNFAGDGPKSRDLVLNLGALIPLLSQFNEQAKSSMLRIAAWALSNLCRGNPQPSFKHVRPALPALARLLFSNDVEVLRDTCWALSYLSAGKNDKVQAVIEAGVCGRLVELLSHASNSVVIPALRTVGNIVATGDLQTQVIINHRSLPCLLRLLAHQQNSIKKETCWIISNITARNREHIQAVIDAGLIRPLVKLYKNSESDIKKEITWALSNAACIATNEQIKYYLGSKDYIKPMCDFLVCANRRIVTLCLEGLDKFLRVGEEEKSSGNINANLYVQMINDVGGLENIENLKSHEDKKINEKVVKILKRLSREL